MKNQSFKFLCAAFSFVFLFNIYAVAQSKYNWLDDKPLPNWNSRSRAILKTERIAPAELARCRSSVRPPTLAADRLLAANNWTLVGAAQVFGRTTLVTVVGGFDGMCRPLGFQTLVFVGNRVAGTLSPAPMDSRTDGSLTNVRLFSETYMTAEYVRYRESDPLCCPYKTEAVDFNVKPDGANFLLAPDTKFGAGGNVENQTGATPPLKNTVWRWQSWETSAGKTTVGKPENYQLEFTADGKVNVTADCNRGRGTYKTDGNGLTFSGIFLTKMGCPPGSLDSHFLFGLEAARTYRIEGNTLVTSGADASGAMTFLRVSRQNQTGELKFYVK